MKKFLYLFSVIFLLPLVFAYPLKISYEILDKNLNLSDIKDYAEYKISIENLGKETITIIPDVSPSDKWIGIFYPSILKLDPGKSGEFKLLIYAKGYERFPNYVTVYFYVKDERFEVVLPVETSGKRIKKEPNVDFEIIFPEKIYINRKFTLKILFKNFDQEPYHSLITFYSDALKDYYRFVEILNPGELQESYSLYANKYEGCYPLNIVLNVEGKIIKKTKTICLEIPPYSINITIKNGNIYIKNLEKTDIIYKFEKEVSSFEEFFYGYDPKPNYEFERNKTKYYVWSLHLNPNETYVIKRYVKAESLFIILLPIIVIILAFVFYTFFLKKVGVSKYIIKVDKEKKIIRIGLYVNNRSRIPVSNVVVKDIIPSPFELIEKFEFGKPSAINKDPEKTELVWIIDKLLPGEVRVITYDIKYKEGLSGTIELPGAKVILSGKIVSISYSVYIHFR